MKSPMNKNAFITYPSVLDNARSWIGTRYHHASDIKRTDGDPGGVDCAMFLVRVFVDAGIVPPFDPRPYPPDWHLHRSAERFLGWIAEFADPAAIPAPGDVALFRFGRCVSHGGIVETIEPEPIMIHADMKAGQVERCEVRRFADRLAGYWRVRG